jgi:hypothetical protein
MLTRPDWPLWSSGLVLSDVQLPPASTRPCAAARVARAASQRFAMALSSPPDLLRACWSQFVSRVTTCGSASSARRTNRWVCEAHRKIDMSAVSGPAARATRTRSSQLGRRPRRAATYSDPRSPAAATSLHTVSNSSINCRRRRTCPAGAGDAETCPARTAEPMFASSFLSRAASRALSSCSRLIPGIRRRTCHGLHPSNE